MARLVFALPLALLSASAWGQTASSLGEPSPTASHVMGKPSPQARSFVMPIAPKSWASETSAIATAELGPNATLGIGIFGLKQERYGMASTTVREVNSRRTRRAGVGFSFKF